MSVKKRLLIALLSATCVTVGAFGFAACTDAVDPEAELKAAYEIYRQEAGEGAFSYNQWLLIIKTGSLNNNIQEDTLKKAYEQYASAAGENAMTYKQWTEIVKSAGVNADEPIDPETALRAAYETYLAAAGEKALSYEQWLEVITSEGVNNDQPIDPETALKAAYETYKAAAGEKALDYNVWLAIIKSSDVNNDSDAGVNQLLEAYKEYVEKAGENALEYSEWLAVIKSEKVNDKEDVNELLEAYKDYSAEAGEDALLYDEWVTLITTGLKDPLETAYQAYLSSTAAANGMALSFEDWQTMIKTYNEPLENKLIESSYVDNHGNFILKFTDDKETIVGKVSGGFDVVIGDDTISLTVPVLYSVRAVDQNDEGAKDIYFRIGYMTGSLATSEYVEVAFGKTDNYGCISFSIVPVEGKTYVLKIADPTNPDFIAKYGNINPLPPYYEIDDFYTGRSFGGSFEMEIVVKNFINAFPYSDTPEYIYSRKYNESAPDNPTVTYEPLELSLTKNVYSYFSFTPYVKPSTVNTSDVNPATGKKYTEEEASTETQRRINNAVAAAVGLYKITVVSDNENVSLFHFTGGTGYVATDPETGAPTDIIKIAGKLPEDADRSLYTGTNYITLNLNESYVSGSYYFWVSSSDNCEVTVTIERIGDAESVPLQIIKMEVTGSPAAYTAQSGTLTLVPVDGSVEIVYSEADGYYHIGSKDGAIVHVNLVKAIGRVTSDGIGIVDYPNNYPSENAVFTYSVEWTTPDWSNQALPVKAYDYLEVVKAYAKLCNSDGVYPVNQDLYDFLQFFGGKCMTANPNSSTNWLIPCQYYA